MDDPGWKNGSFDSLACVYLDYGVYGSRRALIRLFLATGISSSTQGHSEQIDQASESLRSPSVFWQPFGALHAEDRVPVAERTTSSLRRVRRTRTRSVSP